MYNIIISNTLFMFGTEIKNGGLYYYKYRK